MKFVSCLAILSTAASMAAAFVNPTEPWGESVWKPGTNVTITWTDDGVAPKLSTNPVVDIFLNTGGDQTNVKIATVATGINAGTTSSYVYTVPYVDPPGKIYFLTIVGANGGPGMAWSTRFTITDANGNPGTLRPSAPVGSNSGAIGSVIPSPTGGAGATTTSAGGATTTSGAPADKTSGATATATAAGKSGASTLGSSLSVVAAAAVGAAALFAF